MLGLPKAKHKTLSYILLWTISQRITVTKGSKQFGLRTVSSNVQFGPRPKKDKENGALVEELRPLDKIELQDKNEDKKEDIDKCHEKTKGP